MNERRNYVNGDEASSCNCVEIGLVVVVVVVGGDDDLKPKLE